jgi:arylsulfatase A-like enzyme
MQYAKSAVANPELDLVFIHLPVPHLPRLYDRRQRKMIGPRRHQSSDYLDNLALADRTIGELRASMENTGLWDRTAVIVTSDHSFRESRELDGKRDFRVPFIVKLPGKTEWTEFSEPIGLIVLAQLALELLDNGPHDAHDLSGWMSARSDNK